MLKASKFYLWIKIPRCPHDYNTISSTVGTLRIPSRFHFYDQNWYLYLKWSKITFKYIKKFSLIFYSKEPGLKLFFIKVINMSHRHDVINQQLVRHGQKSLSLILDELNKDIDKSFILIVIWSYFRCPWYHKILQKLSDSQEMSISSKEQNFDYHTPEWAKFLVFSLSLF